MPDLQTTDTVEIASDAGATADVLPIKIKRTQEAIVWTGSLQGVDQEVAAIDQRIEEVENTMLPDLRNHRVELVAFKEKLQKEFEKQKPVSSDSADAVIK